MPRIALPILALVPLLLALAAVATEPTPRGLLIVAPQAWLGDLEPLVKLKRQALPTELVALETLLAEGQGVDEPEKLKRTLHRQWKEGRLGYVLLVGDCDVLPVRYMVLDRVTAPAFDYAFYPSDLYYADVARADGSFDDWNRQKEGFHAGYFGEVRGEKNKGEPINFDGVSYVPELAVGRWPVSRRDELKLLVAKSLRYHAGLASGSKPGANRVGFFAVDGWVDSRPTLRQGAERLGKRWQTHLHLYGDAAKPPSEAKLLAHLRDGVGLIVHAGHGETDRWDGCLSLAGLRSVRNGDRLPVLFSAGCSTAAFAPLPPYEAYVDAAGTEHAGTNAGEVFTAPPPPPYCLQKGRFNRTGLGEQALLASEHGAIAYIGCNTGSQPCGLTLVEGFCQQLGQAPGQRLGDLWKETVAHYHQAQRLDELKPDAGWYPPSIFFQGMKFMLFGDPTLPLP